MNAMNKRFAAIYAVWAVLLTLAEGVEAQKTLYRLEKGDIRFRSDAPLEVIEAASTALEGVIDPLTRSFAFSVPVRSFQGFNSPLQREHFNENYLESDKYPRATFSGKIIEEIDLEAPGEHVVRVKGKLTIHGREQERIIRGNLRVAGGRVYLSTDFKVLLAEHNIAIPKIVHQKIAEEIEVRMSAELAAKTSE